MYYMECIGTELSMNTNCEIRIMYCVKCIGTESSMNTTFNPMTYRETIADSLLQTAEKNINNCVYCLSECNNKECIPYVVCNPFTKHALFTAR